METTKITVQVTVNAPIDKVWKFWTSPEHITNWCYAGDDWHAPRAENNLRTGGKFLTRMEAKDGSMGFDFEGVYLDVQIKELIEYILADDRRVQILFTANGSKTEVVETFDPESVNSLELQQNGWQAILNNFKRYTEAN